jgi:hypothetical protein
VCSPQFAHSTTISQGNSDRCARHLADNTQCGSVYGHVWSPSGVGSHVKAWHYVGKGYNIIGLACIQNVYTVSEFNYADWEEQKQVTYVCLNGNGSIFSVNLHYLKVVTHNQKTCKVAMFVILNTEVNLIPNLWLYSYWPVSPLPFSYLELHAAIRGHYMPVSHDSSVGFFLHKSDVNTISTHYDTKFQGASLNDVSVYFS